MAMFKWVSKFKLIPRQFCRLRNFFNLQCLQNDNGWWALGLGMFTIFSASSIKLKEGTFLLLSLLIILPPFLYNAPEDISADDETQRCEEARFGRSGTQRDVVVTQVARAALYAGPVVVPVPFTVRLDGRLTTPTSLSRVAVLRDVVPTVSPRGPIWGNSPSDVGRACVLELVADFSFRQTFSVVPVCVCALVTLQPRCNCYPSRKEGWIYQ